MSPPLGSERVLQLPSELKLVYRAEGAANLVYKIVVPECNGVDSRILGLPETEQEDSVETKQCSSKILASQMNEHKVDSFHGKLLRLRKDQTHTTAPLQALYDFRRYLAPLFRAEELIHPTAVQIDKALLLDLNTELRLLEQQNKRPIIRAGMYLRQESYGTIMDDLGHAPDNSSRIIIELKPKWLLQSPDAPRTARRCRTCALRAYRTAATTQSPEQRRISSFCPLYLISPNEARLSQALHRKFAEEHVSAQIQQHVVSYLANSSLLQRIRHLQATLYPVGVLNADPNNTDFLTVMTLRDCSLFLMVSADGVIGAKLGDLDMKSPARMKHWIATERQLIDGCWYDMSLSGTEHIPCALEGS
ncbi:MAG: hypothetical protein GOMPHAMPRED_006328 [Gomphillus americanus]|uniref:Inositol-pentakisphosphate 2-kinase n=1 Tax=Gomphillus americanus TaxID=1940652 RepID=A0A8H3EMU8_9LECA|nr:MAG: hypothetical protein GOMPHAMPRED_006328 [Gomphillus americanus]